MAYECSLLGLIIGTEQKNAVIERLVGICGSDAMIDLLEHEIVYTPTVSTPAGPARNEDIVLRLVSRIRNEHEKNIKHRQWFLVHQGHPEPQRGRNVIVRPWHQVQISGDVFQFMKSLSYSYSFEVIRKGHLLAYEHDLKIHLTQLYKPKKKIDISTAVSCHENDSTWLVEVVSVPVVQEGVKAMAEQMEKLRALLSSVVDLQSVEHLDIRALRNTNQ